MALLHSIRDFNNLPDEVIITILEQCSPIELYNMMFTSKKHFKLIVDSLEYFIKIFKKSCKTSVERLLWSTFNNYSSRYIINQFYKYMSVYLFAQTYLFEKNWVTNNMIANEFYGPLPEDPELLYVLKFKTGMFITFVFSDLHCDIPISSKLSYSSNETMFKCMFLFMLKYNEYACCITSMIELEFQELDDRGMTFEQLNKCIEDALEIGGDIHLAYTSIYYNTYDRYIELVRNGAEVDEIEAAITDVIE